jgi:hypothetical protein
LAKRKLSKRIALEKKLREYKTVLAKDEDWDWIYILRMLRYKLERTRKCIRANKIIVAAPKVGRQIREVEILLERVEKNRYHDEISKDFRKRYGRLRMISGKREPGSVDIPVTFKYQRETPNNARRIHREAHRLWLRAERMQRRDLEKAFTLMLKNIWGWWD